MYDLIDIPVDSTFLFSTTTVLVARAPCWTTCVWVRMHQSDLSQDLVVSCFEQRSNSEIFSQSALQWNYSCCNFCLRQGQNLIRLTLGRSAYVSFSWTFTAKPGGTSAWRVPLWAHSVWREWMLSFYWKSPPNSLQYCTSLVRDLQFSHTLTTCTA